MKKRLSVVDLFSGCGGLALGFERAGFDVVAGADNWEPALRVYRENFPEHDVLKLDLANVEESVSSLRKYKPTLIVGGPPCQDFSSAGLRNEEGGRGDLTIAYAQIINTLRPKYFVMENVERILKTNKLVEAREIFRKAGYGLSEKVLDASFCGAPQKRKRFIMFGHLGGQDLALLEYYSKNFALEPMTVRNYFKQNRIPIESDFYYRHPRNYSRRAVFSIDEPSPTVRGVNRPVPMGYTGHRGDAAPVAVIRPLSTKERSYIQTFPKSYKFTGTKTDVEQLIGNAVPVKLAEFVATCIMQYIADFS